MYKFYDWINYECELLSASECVYRTTEKYIYTLETVTYNRFHYRINWTPGPNDTFRKMWDCTCFKTREEAEHRAWLTEKNGRGWFITKECDKTFHVLQHRHKRG